MKRGAAVRGDLDKPFDMAESNADSFRDEAVVEYYANAPIKQAEVASTAVN